MSSSDNGTFNHPSPKGRTFPDWEGTTKEAGISVPLAVKADLQPGTVAPEKRMAGA